MSDHLSKFLRDTGLAILAVLLTSIEQFVNTGGLEGTKFAAFAATILVVLNVVRRLLFGATDVPASSSAPAIAMSLPEIQLEPAQAGDETLQGIARNIAFRASASSGASVKDLDPSLLIAIATALVRIFLSCPKSADEIYAEFERSRGFFGRRKRREMRVRVLQALDGRQFRAIRDEIADGIFEEADAATLQDFRDLAAIAWQDQSLAKGDSPKTAKEPKA